MRRPIALLIAFLVPLVAAAPAAAKSYKLDVPELLAKQIAKTNAASAVDVLLPSRYVSDRKRLYGSGGAIDGGGYSFGLSTIPGCGGAGACTVANYYAMPGEQPFFNKTVELTGGVTGYYHGVSCGASCSDPEIQWLDDGILYGFSAAVGKHARKRMIKYANSAIRNGPR